MRESEVMSDHGVGAEAQVLRAILPERAPPEDRVAPIRVHHELGTERLDSRLVLVELAQNERC